MCAHDVLHGASAASTQVIEDAGVLSEAAKLMSKEDSSDEIQRKQTMVVMSKPLQLPSQLVPRPGWILDY